MLEFLLELIGEIVISVALEGVLGNLPEWPARRTWELLGLIAVGGALGWASTFLLPAPLIPWPLARVAYIVIVPVAVAYVISTLSRWRAKRNDKPRLIDGWTDAYLFSLAFSVVRFAATW